MPEHASSPPPEPSRAPPAPRGRPDPRLEPFLFDPPTVDALVELSRPFDSLLLLACPSVARALHDAGDPRRMLLLDLDDRHADLPCYRKADFASLQALPERFALALFDPPALRFPPEAVAALLTRLFAPDQPLLLAYPENFFARIAGDLAPSHLTELPLRPGYSERNKFNVENYRFYANFATR